MKITVIGTGYVGLTSVTMFAELKHEVTGIDTKVKLKVSKMERYHFTNQGLIICYKNIWIRI